MILYREDKHNQLKALEQSQSQQLESQQSHKGVGPIIVEPDGYMCSLMQVHEATILNLNGLMRPWGYHLKCKPIGLGLWARDTLFANLCGDELQQTQSSLRPFSVC